MFSVPARSPAPRMEKILNIIEVGWGVIPAHLFFGCETWATGAHLRRTRIIKINVFGAGEQAGTGTEIDLDRIEVGGVVIPAHFFCLCWTMGAHLWRPSLC